MGPVHTVEGMDRTSVVLAVIAALLTIATKLIDMRTNRPSEDGASGGACEPDIPPWLDQDNPDISDTLKP